MKTLKTLLLAAGVLSAAVAFAGSPDARQSMDRMAGVYKHRFLSGVIVPGKADEPYQAEDVIEIVPYDAGHVYVRVHLDFYNGHSCGIAGMARFDGKRFVYHDPEPPIPGDAPCALRVGIDGDKLTISDRDGPEGVSSCSAYCGARGSLNYEIGLDKRRPIRYLERLKASRQYAKAIEDLRKAAP